MTDKAAVSQNKTPRNVIPEFLKTKYSLDNLKPVGTYGQKVPGYNFVFWLKSTYKNEFESLIKNVANYMGLPTKEINSRLTEMSNPLEYLHKNAVLVGIDCKPNETTYSQSLLFKSKEDGELLLRRLNELLEKEYHDLESQIILKLMLSGEKVSDYQKHNVIFTSRHLAEHFITDFKTAYFFRTLEIVEVVRESSYAVECMVKFHTEVCGQCHLCGKALTDEFSQKTGIGPVCAKKKMGIKKTGAANIEDAIAQIKEIASNFGIVGPVIIPKNQIQRLK